MIKHQQLQKELQGEIQEKEESQAQRSEQFTLGPSSKGAVLQWSIARYRSALQFSS